MNNYVTDRNKTFICPFLEHWPFLFRRWMVAARLLTQGIVMSQLELGERFRPAC